MNINKEGNAMEQEVINYQYKQFMIEDDDVPQYEPPDSFAMRFKIFSLLKDVDTVYSDTSTYYGY
jgi:non-homologous end joining protein Ku